MDVYDIFFSFDTSLVPVAFASNLPLFAVVMTELSIESNEERYKWGQKCGVMSLVLIYCLILFYLTFDLYLNPAVEVLFIQPKSRSWKPSVSITVVILNQTKNKNHQRNSNRLKDCKAENRKSQQQSEIQLNHSTQDKTITEIKYMKKKTISSNRVMRRSIKQKGKIYRKMITLLDVFPIYLTIFSA